MPPLVDVTDGTSNIFLLRCQWFHRPSGDLVLICGKCDRGNIEPKMGFQCRVCKAVVTHVVDPVI